MELKQTQKRSNNQHGSSSSLSGSPVQISSTTKPTSASPTRGTRPEVHQSLDGGGPLLNNFKRSKMSTEPDGKKAKTSQLAQTYYNTYQEEGCLMTMVKSREIARNGPLVLQMNHACGSRPAKTSMELIQKQATLQSVRDKLKIVEEYLMLLQHRALELTVQRLKSNDLDILQTEMKQPTRDDECVKNDVKILAEKDTMTAPLIFLEACRDRGWFSPEEVGDFLGLTAMLARVEDSSLNKVLAEYLGDRSLCRIVTRTGLGLNALKTDNSSGDADKMNGLQSFAHSRGYKLRNTYDVLALSDVNPPFMRNKRRPAVNMEHHQRLLNIDPPVLKWTARVPEGFLGYAVNLLYLKPEHLRMRVDTRTQRGVGLRESLWLNIFKFLQVYDTKENMISAKERLEEFEGGAISLDGVWIGTNKRQQLGRRRDIIPICFSLVPIEERLSCGGLIPKPRLAFERLRQSLMFRKSIKCSRKEVASLSIKRDTVIEELNELQRSRMQVENKD